MGSVSETGSAGVNHSIRLINLLPETTYHFRIIATGDSYNDTTMLAEADAGILFRPPQNVIDEFPQYPVATTYDEARVEWAKASIRDL